MHVVATITKSLHCADVMARGQSLLGTFTATSLQVRQRQNLVYGRTKIEQGPLKKASVLSLTGS